MSGRVPLPKDRVNRAIREKEVRLIDENGEHVGVVAIQDALKRAEDAGLDLVEVSSASKPFVCRVMDYGNYKYEQAKKQKEAKKKQHTTDLKEVKLRPRISGHDYDFKIRNARKFLLGGDKVKFVMMFRGRERSHTEFGYELLEKVQQDLKDLTRVDFKPSAEGRNVIMVLSPDPAGVKTEKARLEKERQRLEALGQEPPKEEEDVALDEPDDMDDVEGDFDSENEIENPD